MARGWKYKLRRKFLQTEDLYPHYVKNSLNKKTIHYKMDKRHKEKIYQWEYASVWCIIFNFLYIYFDILNDPFCWGKTALPRDSQFLKTGKWLSWQHAFDMQTTQSYTSSSWPVHQEAVFLSLNNPRAEYWTTWDHPSSLKTTRMIQIRQY